MFEQKREDRGFKIKAQGMWISDFNLSVSNISFSEFENEAKLIPLNNEIDLLRKVFKKFPYARAILVTEIQEDKTEDLIRLNNL